MTLETYYIREDKTCPDCHIAIPLDAKTTDGLCQQCHLDLMRTVARLERAEQESI